MSCVTKNVTVRFDLREDVPADVGNVYIGKQVRKEYTLDHVPAILEHIAKKIATAKKTTGQESVALCIFGSTYVPVLLAIVANLRGWDDITSIEYGNPHTLPCVVHPLNGL